MPTSVRLTLHGVTIAMGKMDGSEWDGFGRIAPGQLERLATALGAPNPYAEVLAILAAPVNQALAKPEVIGRAMLLTAAGYGPPTQLRAQRDTFTPTFSGPPSWSGVSTNGATRLSVEVADNDAFFPDPVGSFQINSADIMRAVREGRVVQIRVDNQTSRQILFAAISAMPE
ncbi:hypothetical protein [Polyangium jinanense]|uniref:Uncharacterized protein n=1 Tax=Polyangium jinanense TaxID=2829994 RepID=A0A9X3XCM3_9BACT|nr:hypothetical protein [Polyangium jinanense]MDC3961579.1 hypothetical protein [Polyangium jinanense]MDC3987944.1 hypothetical protein [Polyangium jinanense]